MYWNSSDRSGSCKACERLIETWDVLKLIVHIAPYEASYRLIETWDVLKSLSPVAFRPSFAGLIETWDVLKLHFAISIALW